jgi:hypothetical protein
MVYCRGIGELCDLLAKFDRRRGHITDAVVVAGGARGAVRLFALKIGSSIVAMRLGFVARDSLYFYYSGFDPQWARCSS